MPASVQWHSNGSGFFSLLRDRVPYSEQRYVEALRKPWHQHVHASRVVINLDINALRVQWESCGGFSKLAKFLLTD